MNRTCIFPGYLTKDNKRNGYNDRQLPIRYNGSEKQLDKILKTICAYGNNYYNNDIQYIFIGVEEENNEEQKAIPVLPIKGVSEGRLEKCKNTINSLRSFLYPNVAFEVVANDIDGISYLLIIVKRQTGGPFMVAEKDQKINLKPGRYVRIESDTRLARVDAIRGNFVFYAFGTLKLYLIRLVCCIFCKFGHAKKTIYRQPHKNIQLYGLTLWHQPAR